MKKTPEEIYESSLNAVKSILCMTDVLEVHKKELLSLMIWKITERFGKYTPEYITEGASDVLKSNKSTRDKVKLLAHEHVYTRKYLIQQILLYPDRYREILKNAIGCLVTREEHKKLSSVKSKEGWDRYQVANILYRTNIAHK